MSRYLEWARRRPSTRLLVLTLILAGGVFLAGVPMLIAVAAEGMDQALGLPNCRAGYLERQPMNKPPANHSDGVGRRNPPRPPGGGGRLDTESRTEARLAPAAAAGRYLETRRR